MIGAVLRNVRLRDCGSYGRETWRQAVPDVWRPGALSPRIHQIGQRGAVYDVQAMRDHLFRENCDA